ncbi:carbohydrate kinase family protein [Lichenihabitans sp. PAMC28606]|uniref:carbohydrate kinase family protein n=1 Tax=Lichenihabitans sp. PAMC28606 TaxID=2880932 RepID=UPI001D0A075D|nr:carbohydrate kinase family protein [Lichenihabitans sp. PAMC28606]UDL93677.1 carbohydrate kinase family protein [Lichenihabitans sp. PAMC28606]
MNAQLLVIGNVNVDLVMGPQQPWPTPGTEVLLPESDLRVGGAAGNTALAWQALGVPFRLVANTSADALGRWLRDPFGTVGDAWPTSPRACALSVGITHPDGERTFFTTLGHLLDFTLKAVLSQVPADAPIGAIALLTGCFVTPALVAHYGDLMTTLRQRGYRVALDTGWPDGGWSSANRVVVASWLPMCDHLLINEAEALGLTATASCEQAAVILQQHLPAGAILVIKTGAAGARAWCDGQDVTVSAPRVIVIDTIGAGDTFNAGYLAACVAQHGFEVAVAAGVRMASRAVSTRPRRFIDHED